MLTLLIVCTVCISIRNGMIYCHIAIRDGNLKTLKDICWQIWTCMIAICRRECIGIMSYYYCTNTELCLVLNFDIAHASLQ